MIAVVINSISASVYNKLMKMDLPYISLNLSVIQLIWLSGFTFHGLHPTLGLFLKNKTDFLIQSVTK